MSHTGASDCMVSACGMLSLSTRARRLQREEQRDEAQRDGQQAEDPVPSPAGLQEHRQRGEAHPGAPHTPKERVGDGR